MADMNLIRNKSKNNKSVNHFLTGINSKVMLDSVTRLDPRYLIKYNPVMFTVEAGFFLVLFIAFFPSISSEFVGQNQIFYFEIAAILIVTVWFATFSESLSEAQARARVDSLRSLEKEVIAHKIVNGNGRLVDVGSIVLKPGDEVRVNAGEIIPRDGLVNEGKAFIDESMMTGESNPVYKDEGDHVIGGTRVASDSIVVEITAEPGRSFLDQMIGLIRNATRPRTQNEIALTILLTGLSLIFVIVIGTLLYMAYYLGYTVDIATLVALLVALMPTTIGALLPAIGVAGITRLGRDNIVAKSGKGIESAGDCDVLILDKTGTITEGSRSAVGFIPLQKYTEEDVGQAGFAASIHDNSHEGKSIVDLAEEKKFIPPLVERILTAKQMEFSAETKYSGIQFVPLKEIQLSKEQQDELEEIESFDKHPDQPDSPVSDNSSGKFEKMLVNLAKQGREVTILKGAVDTMLKRAHGLVNEDEIKWKSQEISKRGETPLVISINEEVIGLVALKDNMKENIRENVAEIRSTGIHTIMITGDTQVTAQVIAKEADVDEVIAEAKPTDKLVRVEQEQQKGHIIGMVGDGANDAPGLAKADIGLAMNSGVAAAREAANMIDLDSDPSNIMKVVKLGKQLLMTRGAITTFSIANDAAKYFAILPAMFMAENPKLQVLNIMQLSSPETAILSTLIFNAIVIPALVPLSLRGIKFRAEAPQKTFTRNMLIYGLGGAALPFAGIKIIDMILALFMG